MKAIPRRTGYSRPWPMLLPLLVAIVGILLPVGCPLAVDQYSTQNHYQPRGEQAKARALLRAAATPTTNNLNYEPRGNAPASTPSRDFAFRDENALIFGLAAGYANEIDGLDYGSVKNPSKISLIEATRPEKRSSSGAEEKTGRDNKEASSNAPSLQELLKHWGIDTSAPIHRGDIEVTEAPRDNRGRGDVPAGFIRSSQHRSKRQAQPIGREHEYWGYGENDGYQGDQSRPDDYDEDYEYRQRQRNNKEEQVEEEEEDGYRQAQQQYSKADQERRQQHPNNNQARRANEIRRAEDARRREDERRRQESEYAGEQRRREKEEEERRREKELEEQRRAAESKGNEAPRHADEDRRKAAETDVPAQPRLSHAERVENWKKLRLAYHQMAAERRSGRNSTYTPEELISKLDDWIYRTTPIRVNERNRTQQQQPAPSNNPGRSREEEERRRKWEYEEQLRNQQEEHQRRLEMERERANRLEEEARKYNRTQAPAPDQRRPEEIKSPRNPEYERLQEERRRAEEDERRRQYEMRLRLAEEERQRKQQQQQQPSTEEESQRQYEQQLAEYEERRRKHEEQLQMEWEERRRQHELQQQRLTGAVKGGRPSDEEDMRRMRENEEIRQAQLKKKEEQERHRKEADEQSRQYQDKLREYEMSVKRRPVAAPGNEERRREEVKRPSYRGASEQQDGRKERPEVEELKAPPVETAERKQPEVNRKAETRNRPREPTRSPEERRKQRPAWKNRESSPNSRAWQEEANRRRYHELKKNRDTVVIRHRPDHSRPAGGGAITPSEPATRKSEREEVVKDEEVEEEVEKKERRLMPGAPCQSCANGIDFPVNKPPSQPQPLSMGKSEICALATVACCRASRNVELERQCFELTNCPRLEPNRCQDDKLRSANRTLAIFYAGTLNRL